jgi:hypothetical protein
MGIAASLFNIDLSKQIPSLLTYFLGLIIVIAVNYFFYRGLAWVCISLLFVTLTGFFSINREQVLKILEIKNPPGLNFDQRVLVGAFTIAFRPLYRMWKPRKFPSKVTVQPRWFTNFED